MPYKQQATVEGLGPMLATLANLAKAMRTRIVKRAVTKATKVILKRAKQGAPKETKLLYKSLGTKVKTYRSGGAVVGVVGPRTGFKSSVVRKKGKWRPTAGYADPSKYAHLVEGGTKAHPLGKGSNSRKKVGHGTMHPGSAAKPFIAPALAGSASEVRSVMASEIAAGLAAAVKGGAA